MAVIITSQPSDYGLVYNDNPFTFYSTNYTPTQRFQIVVLPSNFPTSPEIAAVRVYPRQDTNGGVNKTYFDPSRILQSLISSDIDIPSSNHNAFFPCNNSHKEYAVFIAEEDKDTSGVYVRKDIIVTNVKSVWNGVQDLIEWVDFDYNLYIMGSSVNRFLTQAPRTQYVNTGDSYFLHFIATSQNNGREYTINVYNEADVLTFTSKITNPNEAFIATTSAYKYQRIAVGAYDIANINPSLSSTAGIGSCLNGASYYTIQLTNGGSAKSEKFTFKLNQQCGKYTPVRLHWLNRLGGYDSFNFNYKSEVKTGVERASFVKQHHTFTGDSWEYNKASRGVTQFDTQTDKMLTVNTGYLTDEQSVWMEDMFASPVIYIERSNELIAVNINGRSIKQQTSLNDKLIQYSFELEYALTNIRQRG